MAMAQNITVIPANRTIGTQKATQKVQKIRVRLIAVYPRNTRSRSRVMRFRSNTILHISIQNRNGKW